MPKQEAITFYYRGMVERGNGNGYDWREGFSAQSENNRPLYPWSTKRECQKEAKLMNAKAVFIWDDAHKIA